MSQTSQSSSIADIIDRVIPLAEGHPVHTLRHERPKVVASTQGSYDGMFAAEVRDISVTERLLAALHGSRLSRSDELATHYRERLLSEGVDAALVDAVDAGVTPVSVDGRLSAILAFTGKLIVKPVEGDRTAVESLVAVGLSTPAIVALGQLIAFLSYQIRVAAGLKAMAAATGASA